MSVVVDNDLWCTPVSVVFNTYIFNNSSFTSSICILFTSIQKKYSVLNKELTVKVYIFFNANSNWYHECFTLNDHMYSI